MGDPECSGCSGWDWLALAVLLALGPEHGECYGEAEPDPTLKNVGWVSSGRGVAYARRSCRLRSE